MKKVLKIFLLTILIISLYGCFNKKEQTNSNNNNIENYLQNNNETENFEEIISNTVQYGNKDDNNQEQIEERKYETTISCQDCFHNIGFAEKECEQTGKYFFERNKNENDEYDLFDWQVFVFDERQKYKDIKDNYQAILTNEGEIDIKKGQYIYILCSYNPETEVLPANSNQSYIYYMK